MPSCNGTVAKRAVKFAHKVSNCIFSWAHCLYPEDADGNLDGTWVFVKLPHRTCSCWLMLYIPTHYDCVGWGRLILFIPLRSSVCIWQQNLDATLWTCTTFQHALHAVLWTCSWNFQHARWNFQHARGATRCTSSYWNLPTCCQCYALSSQDFTKRFGFICRYCWCMFPLKRVPKIEDVLALF